MKILRRSESEKREVKKIAEHKRANEVALAKKLQEVFNEEPLRSINEYLAAFAISDILESVKFDKQPRLDQHIKKEAGKYRVFKDDRRKKRPIVSKNRSLVEEFKEIGKLAPTRKRIGFDAADCADILCFYGDWVEQGAEGKLGDFCKAWYGTTTRRGDVVVGKGKKAKIQQKLRRVWSYEEWRQARRELRGKWMILDGEVNGRTYKAKDKESKGRVGKMYERRPGRDPHDQLKLAVNFFKAAKFMQYNKKKWEEIKKSLQKEANWIVRVREESVKQTKETMLKEMRAIEKIVEDEGVDPGRARWKLLPESSIYQLDRMFGLPEGADISGTTGDTVFALEVLFTKLVDLYLKDTDKKTASPATPGGEKGSWWAQLEDLLNMRPLLVLLPLATMVSRGHHTLLECAMTLTMNDYIDYSVGFYTSLYPKYLLDRQTGWPAKLERETDLFLKGSHKKIWGILESAERGQLKYANPKMVSIYDSPAGGRLMTLISKRPEEQLGLRDVGSINDNFDTYLPWVYGRELGWRYPSRVGVCDALLKHGLAGWIDNKRANEYNKYFGRKWVRNEATLKLNSFLWEKIRG